EGTTFINGSTIASNDPTGTAFSGVFTHEFGHALNLRHSQVNGAIRGIGDAPFPYGCTNQPYAGAPGVGPTNPHIETQDRFLNQVPGGTAQGMFTVDRLDDIAAISDLYPAPGWPENHGTIQGTISYLTKILGNGTGPSEQITGVNVIARNLADPYNDFISTTS